jgi:hypothetical protein
MSIRYNRQYREDSDIFGPIGPVANEQPLDFLNNDDVYLRGGGGASGGGGGNNNVEPPVENPINPPVEVPVEPSPENPTPNDLLPSIVNYEIAISSNLEEEVGDFIKLKYDILFNGSIQEEGEVLLADFNTDGLSISKEILTSGILNLYLENNLPSNYSISKIYYTNRLIAQNNPTDYSKWKVGNDFIGLQASELLTGGVAVAVILEKEIAVAKPTIFLDSTIYSKQVKDSDSDSIINIKFNQTDCDYVYFYISETKSIRIDAKVGNCALSFLKDFGKIYGNKKLIIVPYSDLYGTGDKIEISVNFISVNDFPSITEIIYPDVIDIPAFSDLEIDYEIQYNAFAATSVDFYLLLKDKSKIDLFKSQPANGNVKINLKKLRESNPSWVGSTDVTLILKPINNSGDVLLEGNEYEIKTLLTFPAFQIDEDIIKKSVFDAFLSNLGFQSPEKESKYLTHLTNFGNDEQTIISSWENDNWTLSKKSVDELGNEFVKPEDEINSIILKLYNPLPANIQKNSTFWITKLMSNPLVETVILTQQNEIEFPTIKGPNFSIDVDLIQGKSTGYESLDTILLNNDVTSSSTLVASYLSSSLTNTDDLNIDYSNGTEYLWNNFVHFSSAKERVDNFVYKVQLIENYETAISSSYYTGSGNGLHTGSISSIQERERQLLKKNQLINNFDGFEKFLYTSSSLSWPHSNTTNRLISTSDGVINWYNDLIDEAEQYDIQNVNWVQNNIPQFIVNNEENRSLLLFFSMIGQHFDNIYFYTKSIEKSRNLGYKSKDGVSDKLLHDVLKSFNWDAKNLAADSKLWEYTFGLDLNGEQKFDTPAKQRTYEVWRRILNNLPYLLKNKGTRKGIYALLSCYGIPSSNLSIFEFGGPEVNEKSKSKLVYDNITTALKMSAGSYIDFEWKNTERNRKPDTIELFVKSAVSSEYTLISGSGWNVVLSGSVGNEYGKVILNYSGSNYLNAISSSLLPIFNDKFFGISVSRETSGGNHNLELSVRQSNKERTTFEETKATSVLSSVSYWNSGSILRLGNGFVGSVDEFRLWSTPLDKERFYEHVSFPEMINGNHISSSTDDLFFRLDFEYPKDLAVSSSLLNVDANIYFSSSLYRNDLESGSITPGSSIFSENPSASYSASAYFPNSITTYPYQFEVIDRTVVLEIPDAGSTRYSTNKVRFESQTDFNGNDVSGGVNLSVKNRATKKAFDQSPTDSNRVGLFFSPTKELNIDIAKSFGGINLDNYIGDPSDNYKSNYSTLDSLRNYYFKRFDGRDIYAYINLIKLYEKSMFEDIKKMLPARVKATTGLLIEPHILERSKIAQKRPTGDDYQLNSEIKYSDTTFTFAENNQYETIINADLSENVSGENNQYYAEIYTASLDTIIAENYQYDAEIFSSSVQNVSAENYQYEVSVSAVLNEATFQTEIDIINGTELVGQSVYEEIGFGIYADNGYAIRTYFNSDNKIVKERIKVDLIKEQKQRDIVKYKVVVNGKGDPRGGTELTSSIYYETKLNIQPYSGSKVINAGTGSIVEVTPLSGYLPTHYRNTSDLTRGLENSFFRGSKNTAATTLDGSSPIETFVSNPNTLTVNKTGRSTSEPILEVD